tara:strand:+ start:4362 stop:5216 length:855 start_codon:yes stop_codon:yes gene_type:complete
MSKLYKLKKWLTIQEAINHISSILDEPVTEADIYRLALDDQLTLAVNLVNGAYVHLGAFRGIELVPIEKDSSCESDAEPIPSEVFDNTFFAGNGLATLDTERIDYISGVWDLHLIGAGKLKLESDYHQLIDGINVKAMIDEIEGVFVIDYEEEVLGRLLTKKDNDKLYTPSSKLDEHDYVLVIRTVELNRFLANIADKQNLSDNSKAINSQLNFSDEIAQSDTWQSLYKLTEKAVEEFPNWQKTRQKPNNISKDHIRDWLINTVKMPTREAEIVKKVLDEIFNL